MAHLFSDNGGVPRCAECVNIFSTNATLESSCDVVLSSTRPHDESVEGQHGRHDVALRTTPHHTSRIRGGS